MEKKTLVFENFKGNPDYDGIKWCISARSYDACRPNIKLVNIQDGLMVATDGHRMHMFSPTAYEVEDGNWEVISCCNKSTVLQRDALGLQYPDYMRLFDGVKLHNGIPKLQTNKEKSDKSLCYETKLTYHVWHNARHQYNLRFLFDACPASGDDWDFKTAPNGMIVITNEPLSKLAVIMPLRNH